MVNNRKKILLVEDDSDLRHQLVTGLGAANFDLIEAADGEEAVTKALDNLPDLIVLDLLLPKLDGFRVLERIRHYPDKTVAAIKVLVLSNLYSNKDILMAEALKIDGYFVKANTNLEDVYAKIRQILSEKQQKQSVKS